jgi:hypothetical protein
MAENGKLPPEQLAPIAQGQLATECAAGWNALNVEARARGVELLPTGSMSSYRTYEQQVYLYEQYLNGTGNLAAVPGTSNHGMGTAVDLATTEMRDMIDQIGAQYGWSKSWSDAQDEWWHICYQPGHYSGPDPGPYGEGTPPTPEPIEETDMICAVVKKDGRIEVFVEKADSGQIWHTWQTSENGGWTGSAPGKTTTWQSLGTPGGK